MSEGVEPDPTAVVAFVSTVRADKGTLPQGLTKGKTCPRCAQTVRSAAVICRFCGHEFEERVDAPKSVA